MSNWFAIGGGAGMLIVGISAMLGKMDKMPRPAGFALTLAGALFIYLGMGTSE